MEAARTSVGFLIAAEAPDGLDAVVLGESLGQLRGMAGDEIHNAAGHVAGVEQLIEIADDERITIRRHGDNGVADGDGRQHQRKQTEQRRFAGRENSDGADGFGMAMVMLRPGG